MKDILLIGGGGHCRSIIDVIESSRHYNILGIIDKKEKIGSLINGVEIIGEDNDLMKYRNKGVKYAFISIGSIGYPQLRIQLFNRAKLLGYEFPIIIDRTAVVSKNAVLGEGTFVGKGCIINTDCTIGRNCIINTASVIEHDCIIEDFVHISPGSVLSGGVFVGENSHIGTNSTIIQNITIGANTIVGAGSVVVGDLKNNIIAYGNPCRVVED